METMRVLVLLCVLAAAAAAPWRDSDHYGGLDDFMTEDHLFDTNRFWANLEARIMQQLLEDLSKHFPSDVSSEGVEEGSYRVVVPLQGFEEKDIVVKAQPGALMIQAVKTDRGRSTSYLNARTLPAGVDPAGRWGYDSGVLTIAFPMKASASTEGAPVSVGTEAPHSREELETEAEGAGAAVRESEVEDMVRGGDAATVSPGDVEESTYAVDLTGDVEFVPVQVK